MTTPETFAQRSLLHRIGLYLLMFAVFGGVGGALIYITLMQYSGWPVSRSAGWFGMAPAGTSAKVIVYRSPTTERFLTSVGGRYSTLIQPWRDFGRQNSVQLSEVDDLTALTPKPDEVLVLPSAVALSPVEREAVRTYQSRGGRLLLTWAVGSRDGSGQWVGWDFLRAVAGVQVSSELARSQSNYAIETRGEGPLTHIFPPGALVGLAQTAELPLQFRGASIAGYAVDISKPDGIDDLTQGILTFQETPQPESSRVVMFGASESTWAYNPADIHRLLNGAFDWLIRQPVVFPSQWPNGTGGAYAIAVEVDKPSELDSAKRLPAALASEAAPGYRGSLLLSPDLARRQPRDELMRLNNDFDLGFRCEGPGFKGQPLAEQKSRIQSMKAAFDAAGQSGQVFECNSDSTDDKTRQALYESGIYSQLSLQSSWRGGLPFFAAVPKERAGQRFVVIPSYAHHNLSEPVNGVVDSADSNAKLKHPFDVVRARGGFAVGTYRPPVTADAASEARLSALASDVQSHSRQVWFTTVGEVSRWWNDRERFQVGIRPFGAKVELDVSVIGEEVFNGGALIVMVPTKNALPKVRGLKNNMPTAVVEPLDDFRAVVRFGPLSTGNYSYQLSY